MPIGTTFTVTCNGVDISDKIDMETIEGDNSITERQDELKFTLTDPQAATIIKGKQEVIVSDQGGTRWFGGLVGQVTRRSETKVRLWDVDVLGYVTLLDSSIVNKIYTNWTDTAIIADVLSSLSPSPGITLSSSVTPTTISSISLPYKTVTEALDALCHITGNKYYVDPHKVLYYLSPIGLTPSATLSDQADNVSTFSYENWQMMEDATQIQNRVTVIGGDYVSPGSVSDTFTGDGSTTVFTLSHRPYAFDTLTVAGVTQTAGHYGVDGYGGASNITCLINDAQQTLTFQVAPASGAAIVATYNYHQPVLVQVPSTSSFLKYGRWFDGKVTDSTLLTPAAARTQGLSVLAQYQDSQWQGQLRTRYCPYVRSGLGVQIVNAIDLVSASFLVSQNRWSCLGGGVVVQDMQVIGTTDGNT